MGRSIDAGRLLRSVASRGWAEEDAEIVAELLEQARGLAALVVADQHASPEARSVAEELLDRLRSDTFSAGEAAP